MYPISERKSLNSLTVIVPVFNEEKVLPAFLASLKPVVNELRNQLRVQILFVNNGSTDRSLELIMADESLGVAGVLTLSSNFGYEAAIIAGIQNSDSTLYCVIDADGEDDPKFLLDFFESIKKGNYIAIGIRGKRIESWATQKFRSITYKIMSKLSDDSFIVNGGNFLMFHAIVKSAIVAENMRYPFMRATIARSGFQFERHFYDRKARLDGKSKFRYLNLVKFAWSGFLTSTTWPLRLISYFTMATVPLVILIGGLAKFLDSSSLPIISITLVTTEILVATALMSAYLARIYKISLGRPIYYVDPYRSFFHDKFETSLNRKTDFHD